MENQYQRVEDEYFRLKGQLATGRITREQFENALRELMFTDAQGRYWMLGADSGKWFVHDGAQWVEANPQTGTAPIPPTHLPERGTRFNRRHIRLVSRAMSVRVHKNITSRLSLRAALAKQSPARGFRKL